VKDGDNFYIITDHGDGGHNMLAKVYFENRTARHITKMDSRCNGPLTNKTDSEAANSEDELNADGFALIERNGSDSDEDNTEEDIRLILDDYFIEAWNPLFEHRRAK
jgi:hypothetical protein